MAHPEGTSEASPLLPTRRGAASSPGGRGVAEELYGYALMALSTLGFCGMTFVVHLLGSANFGFAVSALFIVWCRSVVQLGCAGLYLLLAVDFRSVVGGVTPARWGLLVARGACGTVGFICLFKALSLLPLGDAITLFFIGPILTSVLTSVTLHEKVSSLEATASLVSFAGVALIAQPSVMGSGRAAAGNLTVDAAAKTLGVVLALSAALLSAVAYTLVRKLGGSVHFIMNVLALGVCSTVITTAWLGPNLHAYIANAALSRLTVALLVAQGGAAFFGQCCLNKALQHCSGMGVMLRNLDVPLAYLLGIGLGEVPSWRSTIGALLVLTATAAITFRQAVRS
jgi:drug/metabolite transporter (DMT)-like permease